MFIRHSGRTQKNTKYKLVKTRKTDSRSTNTCIQKVQKYTLSEQTFKVIVNNLPEKFHCTSKGIDSIKRNLFSIVFNVRKSFQLLTVPLRVS